MAARFFRRLAVAAISSASSATCRKGAMRGARLQYSA
jgi:hypothetical protein